MMSRYGLMALSVLALAVLASSVSGAIDVSVKGGCGSAVLSYNVTVVEPFRGVATGYKPFIVLGRKPVAVTVLVAHSLPGPIPLVYAAGNETWVVTLSNPIPLGLAVNMTIKLPGDCLVELKVKPPTKPQRAGGGGGLEASRTARERVHNASPENDVNRTGGSTIPLPPMPRVAVGGEGGRGSGLSSLIAALTGKASRPGPENAMREGGSGNGTSGLHGSQERGVGGGGRSAGLFISASVVVAIVLAIDYLLSLRRGSGERRA